jgi:hypothetical protein
MNNNLEIDFDKMALNIDTLENENRKLNHQIIKLQRYCHKQQKFNDAQTIWLKQLKENNDEIWKFIKNENKTDLNNWNFLNH